MMVITPKHVEAVLMQIVILLLKQFCCASVGNKTLILPPDFRQPGYALFQMITFSCFRLLLCSSTVRP